MWSKKLLVAYDGSVPSHKALDIAGDIAATDPEIEVILVHVMLLFTSGASGTGIDAMMLADAEAIESELEEVAAKLPNPVVIEILRGTSPADLIIACAKDHGCDLIIMGSRGKGGVRGYLGSVSYKVTKDSPVTVMVAKDGA